MPDHFFYLGYLSFYCTKWMQSGARSGESFPDFSFLADDMGFKVFMIAHIPLFFFLFLGLLLPENGKLIHGLNIFFVVHLVLHILFLKHKKKRV